jgi:hypothetical protein
MTDMQTSDRDVSRAIRSWLREDRHEDASRIAGAVLDRVEATSQRRATWWPARRMPIMNKIATIGLGAAAVVVAVFVGAQLFGSPSGGVGGPGEEPTAAAQPSLTATPMPSPTARAPEPTPAALAEGPFVLVDERLFGVRATVTIPAPDWHGLETNTNVVKHGMAGPPEGASLVAYGGNMLVYGDPCEWESTRPDDPATSLDAFVGALSAQASRDASRPVDVTVGGYPAKMLTLTVPEDATFADCDGGEFRTLMEVSSSGDEAPRFHEGPGQISEVWVVDVDGTLVFFDAGYFADTPTEYVEEMRAIVESATFEAP